MSKTLDRRKFLKLSGTAAAAAMISSPLMAALGDQAAPRGKAAAAASKRVKFAVIGLGNRGTFWSQLIHNEFSQTAELVAMCDINPGRAEASKKYARATCPTFTDLDALLDQTRPDYLFVTTPDSTHDSIIIHAMEKGFDIITEKPMTIDEDKTQAILDAQKRTGRRIIVAFNYRWANHRAKIWELLNKGEIGELTSVDFHWYLDTSHGADYFRRWHRLRAVGGSLWLHKASHHFDLLNWWIGSEPSEVFAAGKLEFYGKNGPYRAENCRSCSHTKECKFYWDVNRSERNRLIYTDNEHYDGYLRDGCVFKEDVDIFDKMAATIKYANGVQVSYSLTAYSPYEGYRIAFNGTKGRIDMWVQESNPTFKADYVEIMVTHNFGTRDYIRVIDGPGGHDGGDPVMLRAIIADDNVDAMRQRATLRQGALAILIGIAARKSCDTGQVIKIGDLTEIKPIAEPRPTKA